MEQLVILLVVGAIGLVKWLLEKSAEQRGRRDTEERLGELERENPPVPPHHRRPIDSFPRPIDPTMRRLREALGLPDDADLPPARTAPLPPLPKPKFSVDQIQQIPVTDIERRLVTPPPRAARRKPEPELVANGPLTGLDELLRSREGLRRAILVQEILGTPKGLVF